MDAMSLESLLSRTGYGVPSLASESLSIPCPVGREAVQGTRGCSVSSHICFTFPGLVGYVVSRESPAVFRNNLGLGFLLLPVKVLANSWGLPATCCVGVPVVGLFLPECSRAPWYLCVPPGGCHALTFLKKGPRVVGGHLSTPPLTQHCPFPTL